MASKKGKGNENGKLSADFFKKGPQKSHDSSGDTQNKPNSGHTEDDRLFNMKDISEMLTDIKSVFKAEIRGAVDKITDQIRELGERTASLEQQYDHISESLQHKEEKLMDHESRIQLLENKIEDLENRSRRDNLRLRGIPETVLDLSQYTKSLYKSLLPDIHEEMFRMDRIHRVASRQTRPVGPRDVLLKLHYPELKWNILKAAREIGPEGIGEHKIQIFPDISSVTVDKRRRMKPVTNILRSHDIRYKWAFPFALTFRLGQTTHSINNVLEGLALMKKLELTGQPTMDMTPSPNENKRRDWTEVTSRKKLRKTIRSPSFSRPKSYRRISEKEDPQEGTSASTAQNG